MKPRRSLKGIMASTKKGKASATGEDFTAHSMARPSPYSSNTYLADDI